MRNEFITYENTIEILINSRKYGKQSVWVDLNDLGKLKGGNICLFGTPRHHTLYATIKFPEQRELRLHRLLLNPPTEMVIDHINGNGLDNRKENLRITTQLGNNANARKRKNARTSKYKGVHQLKTNGKWKAQIQRNKKKIIIGTFPTELEAAQAYNAKALEVFGEFAKINIFLELLITLHQILCNLKEK